MQRAKIKSTPNITLRKSELEKMKLDISKQATDRACLILLAAAVDELELNDERMISVMKRTERYVHYIDDHIAKMEDIRNTIEKATGIKLTRW